MFLIVFASTTDVQMKPYTELAIYLEIAFAVFETRIASRTAQQRDQALTLAASSSLKTVSMASSAIVIDSLTFKFPLRM